MLTSPSRCWPRTGGTTRAWPGASPRGPPSCGASRPRTSSASTPSASSPPAARDGERILVSDFGIARSLETVGATTIAAGTPHYMAPEQSEGRAGRTSDVYSAAVILYQLLAGSVPFPFPTAGQVIRAQLTSEAADIRTLRADTPAPLAATIARALARSPESRPQTAEAWRAEIHGAGEPDPGMTLGPQDIAAAQAAAGGPQQPPQPPPPPNYPPSAPPPGWQPPPPPPRRGGRGRQRALVALVIVALLAAVTGIAVASAGKASAGEVVRTASTNVGDLPFSPPAIPASTLAKVADMSKAAFLKPP